MVKAEAHGDGVADDLSAWQAALDVAGCVSLRSHQSTRIARSPEGGRLRQGSDVILAVLRGGMVEDDGLGKVNGVAAYNVEAT